MEQYLIDTNIVSGYLSAVLPTAGMKFMDKVIDAIPKFSVISQIELLCWKTNDITEQQVKNFIADSIVLNISTEVITQCVTIRKNKKIKTPDAIIAATALVHNFTIVTNNEKDFANINELKLVNPMKLF